MTLTPLQRLAQALRKMHLLQLADFFWFLRLYWLNRKGNRSFRRRHPEALVPPPLVLYDIQGNCDLEGFYQSGLEHAREVSRLISGRFPGDVDLEVLEWGCGPARVLQHLRSPGSGSWRLWGSDYNPESIAWCQQHFPDLRFVHNQLEPPIPAPDAHFDVIYCLSVFTHLSEPSHYKWVAELQRLLKPGGMLIGTFHGDAFRDQLTEAEKTRYDAGELVCRDKVREGKRNYSAYHCDGFVRRLLAPFDQVTKLDAPPGFRQTLWAAVKKVGTGP